MNTHTRWLRHAAGSGLLIASLLAARGAPAYSLWSTPEAEPGTGEIHLAREHATLGEMRLRNLLLVGPSSWLVPFSNNGATAPNVCATATVPTGKGAPRINENVDVCPTALGSGELSMFVIEGGRHQGNEIAIFGPTGELSVSADVVLRVGNSAPARTAFYATSGTVSVPAELRPRVDEIARRLPWMAAGAGELRGRVGDFNGNGWIDGTLVAIGSLPGAEAGKPGAPYLMIRHFETDLPVAGVLSGNVKGYARAGLQR